jgi:hypothetical protein
MSSSSRADRLLEFPDGYRVAPAPLSASWFETDDKCAAIKYTQNILSLQLVARIPLRRATVWPWTGRGMTEFDSRTMFEVTNTAIGSDSTDDDAEEDDDYDSGRRYVYVPCFYEWPVPSPHLKLAELKNKTAPWARVWLPDCIVDRASPPSSCRLTREMDGGTYIQAVFYLQSTLSLDAAAAKAPKSAKGKKGPEETIRMTWTIVDAMIDRMVTPDIEVLDVRELRICNWQSAVKWTSVIGKRLATLSLPRLKSTRVPHNCGEAMSVINLNPELRALCTSMLLQVSEDAPDLILLNKVIEGAIAAVSTHHFPKVAHQARFNKHFDNVQSSLKKFMLFSGKSCTCGRCVYESFASYSVGCGLVSSTHPPSAMRELPAKVTYDRGSHTWNERAFDDGFAALRWSCLMGPDLGYEDTRAMLETSLDRVRKITRLIEDTKELGGCNVERAADFVCTLFRVICTCLRDTLATFSRIYPRFMSTSTESSDTVGGPSGADSTSAAGAGAKAVPKLVAMPESDPPITTAASPPTPPAVLPSTSSAPVKSKIAADSANAARASKSKAPDPAQATVASAALPAAKAPATPPAPKLSAAGGASTGQSTPAGAVSPLGKGDKTRPPVVLPTVGELSSYEEISDPLRLQVIRRQAYVMLKLHELSAGEMAVVHRQIKAYESQRMEAISKGTEFERRIEQFDKQLTELWHAMDLNERRADNLVGKARALEERRAEVTAMAEALHELQERVQLVAQERDKLKSEVDTSRTSLSSVRAAVAAAETGKRALETRIDELKKALEAAKGTAVRPTHWDRDMENAAEQLRAAKVRQQAAEDKCKLYASEHAEVMELAHQLQLVDVSRSVEQVQVATADRAALAAREVTLHKELAQLKTQLQAQQAQSTKRAEVLKHLRSEAHGKMFELDRICEHQAEAFIHAAGQRDMLAEQLAALHLASSEGANTQTTSDDPFNAPLFASRQESRLAALGGTPGNEMFPSTGLLLGSLGVEF